MLRIRNTEVVGELCGNSYNLSDNLPGCLRASRIGESQRQGVLRIRNNEVVGELCGNSYNLSDNLSGNRSRFPWIGGTLLSSGWVA